MPFLVILDQLNFTSYPGSNDLESRDAMGQILGDRHNYARTV